MKFALALLLALLIYGGLLYAGPSQSPYGSPTTPTITDEAISPSFNVGYVTVTQAVTLIKAAPTYGNASFCTAAGVPWACCTAANTGASCGQHYRYSILIRNTGGNTIYIGSTNTVTGPAGATPGFPLLSNDRLTLDKSYTTVYGICASGQTSTVAFLEEAQ